MKRTALVVAAVMAALYAIDQALANLETREVRAEAMGNYSQGETLLANGKARAAVEAFHRAYAMDRTNRQFQVGLAGAQLTAGDATGAETALQEVLDRDSNDGRANFLMARIRLAQGRVEDAVAYYHRAIYGLWRDGGDADRLNARLELAGILAQNGRKQELLSELLLLDEASAKDTALARKVGALYLQAGSAGRAREVFQRVLRAGGESADVYAGLGRAELQLGEYRAAQAAFEKAGGDQVEIELAGRLARLDPTSRRLPSVEKFRRSDEILGMAADAVGACAGVDAASKELLASADKLRKQKATGMPSNEAAEARLTLAEQIWNARPAGCVNEPDSPLAILIQRIAQ